MSNEQTTTPVSDPFDPASLRLSADYTAGLAVKKMLTVIPVRKPNNKEWFRVRPGDDWQSVTATYEDEALRETYLVHPDIRDGLARLARLTLIVTAINRGGELFLWPLKLPGSRGRSSRWNESALAIAREARTGWRRMDSNRAAGHYDGYKAEAELSEPEWPAWTFREIFDVAFKDRLIDGLDHPLLRQLRGRS